jgi:hypothetical protein
VHAFFFCASARMRASAPLRPAPGASEDGAAPENLSICHRLARAIFAARLDERALRRSCARNPKLGPARARSTMALSARACCAGAAAKAPTKRAARRNRRRIWCLGYGLTPAEEAASAAMEATYARHRRNATVSSASLRSPRGRAPSGASVLAGSMPPASPTPPRREQGNVDALQGIWGGNQQNRGRRRWRDCLHAPRPAI